MFLLKFEIVQLKLLDDDTRDWWYGEARPLAVETLNFT